MQYWRRATNIENIIVVNYMANLCAMQYSKGNIAVYKNNHQLEMQSNSSMFKCSNSHWILKSTFSVFQPHLLILIFFVSSVDISKHSNTWGKDWTAYIGEQRRMIIL